MPLILECPHAFGAAYTCDMPAGHDGSHLNLEHQVGWGHDYTGLFYHFATRTIVEDQEGIARTFRGYA